MSLPGVKATNLPLTGLSDAVMVVRNGNARLQDPGQLAAQLEAISGPTYETRALLYADLAWAEGSVGKVVGDATLAFRGIYKKSGASGSGSWVRIGPLPEADAEGLAAEITAAREGKADLVTNVAAVRTEVSQATPIRDMSVTRNGSLDRSRLGSVYMPTSGGNGPSYTRIMRELEEWFLFISNSSTFAWPESAMVDGIRSPYSKSERAYRARMIRSTSGTVRSEVQLRQIYRIPPDLWDKAFTVRLSYVYKIDAAGPLPVSTGLITSPNADMSSGYLVPSVTKRTTDVIGDVAVATYDAIVPADQGARYFVFGPRFNMATGTPDIDTYAYLLDVSVMIQPSAYYGVGKAQVEEFAADLAAADRAPDRSRNLFANATFWDDPVGPLGSAAPSGWLLQGGGGGTYAGAREIVEATGLPVRTQFPLHAMRCVETHDGSIRTDNQIRQSIPLPIDLIGTTDRYAVVMFWGVRSHANISLSALAYLQDAGGATLTAPTMDLIGSQPAVGEWGLLRYRVRLTDAAAVQMQVRLRSLATASFAGEEYSLKAAPFVAFDVNPYLDHFEIPLVDEMQRTARRKAAEVVAETLPGGITVTSGDRYADALGNLLPVLPSRTIIVIGDSQSDSLDGHIAAALPGRTIVDGGIGGEWLTTHILNRIRGHALAPLPSFASAGIKRLGTRRAVPPRCIVEPYRAQWSDYGVKIAEPYMVEFFNATGLIGRSYDQHRSAATVSGTTLTAAGHPWANGDQVYVLQADRPTAMYRGKVYYVRDITSSTFRLAEFSGGAAIDFGGAFGDTVEVLGGFYSDWDYDGLADTTISLKTYTNWSESTLILNGDTNDLGNGVFTGPVIAAYEAAIAEVKTLVKRVLLHTTPGFYPWTTGSTEHTAMRFVDNYLLRRYPATTVDTYPVLLASGNGGTDDNADIAQGLVPRSLRIAADDGHINSAGNIVRAAQIVERLQQLGW